MLKREDFEHKLLTWALTEHLVLPLNAPHLVKSYVTKEHVELTLSRITRMTVKLEDAPEQIHMTKEAFSLIEEIFKSKGYQHFDKTLTDDKPDVDRVLTVKCFNQRKMQRLLTVEIINKTTEPSVEQQHAIVSLILFSAPEGRFSCHVSGLKHTKIRAAYFAADLLINNFESSGHKVSDIYEAIVLLHGESGIGRIQSFPRSIRKRLAVALNTLVWCKDLGEDFAVHQSDWRRIFHSMHISEYIKSIPGDTSTLEWHVKCIRADEFQTYNSKVEKLITNYTDNRDLAINVAELLERKPIQFAKRVVQLVRLGEIKFLQYFIEKDIISKVPIDLVFKIVAEFKRCRNHLPKMILPNSTNPLLIIKPEEYQVLNYPIIEDMLMSAIRKRVNLEELIHVMPNFPEGEDLQVLQDTGVSSKSSEVPMTRGSKYKLPDSNTIRAHLWWVGNDVDLSISMHNSEFSYVDKCTFSDLTPLNTMQDTILAKHYEDVQKAPNGAAEYIDIDVKACLDDNVRYVALHGVYYTDTKFSSLDTCNIGWTGVDRMQEHAPTENYGGVKLDQDCSVVICAVFDLHEGIVQYLDIPSPGCHTNNVYDIDNPDQVSDTISKLWHLPETKTTVGDVIKVLRPFMDGHGEVADKHVVTFDSTTKLDELYSKYFI